MEEFRRHLWLDGSTAGVQFRTLGADTSVIWGNGLSAKSLGWIPVPVEYLNEQFIEAVTPTSDIA
jgi:hypothetical protein